MIQANKPALKQDGVTDRMEHVGPNTLRRGVAGGREDPAGVALPGDGLSGPDSVIPVAPSLQCGDGCLAFRVDDVGP